jgi:sterol desaturase/sphingolipid hydroxylase (fatty acid hydroxylase superfamily)
VWRLLLLLCCRFPSRHFSLYFTHWDRWMGTLHPKYDATLFRYFS